MRPSFLLGAPCGGVGPAPRAAAHSGSLHRTVACGRNPAQGICAARHSRVPKGLHKAPVAPAVVQHVLDPGQRHVAAQVLQDRFRPFPFARRIERRRPVVTAQLLQPPVFGVNVGLLRPGRVHHEPALPAGHAFQLDRRRSGKPPLEQNAEPFPRIRVRRLRLRRRIRPLAKLPPIAALAYLTAVRRVFHTLPFLSPRPPRLRVSFPLPRSPVVGWLTAGAPGRAARGRQTPRSRYRCG
jgi:hypothetical protein